MNRQVVSVLVALLVPGVAWGQGRAAMPAPPPPPAAASAPPVAPSPPSGSAAPVAQKSLSESLGGAAKADYEGGKLLWGDGDFKGALVKFASAFAASKDARLLWNMAACEKELRHYARAVADINRYIVEGGASLSEQDRAEAMAKRDTLQAFISPVTIRVGEPDAEVTVDGEPVGRSPLGAPIVTDIGEHRFGVRKPGFREFTQTLQVSGPTALDVTLTQEAHEGRLEVRAPDGAQITMDGQSAAIGTWRGTLPSGTHMVAVSAPGMRTYRSEVAIQDSDVRTLSVALEPENKGGGVPAWVWVTGGVLVAGGVAVGGYYAFHKTDTTSSAQVGTLMPGTVTLQVFR